jgi:calcineurin-like phosphoesterase family protein
MLDAVPSATLEYGNNNFLLIHDPADALPSFDGWVIHGHHHNNDLRCFPFVNFKERRINVSAEVLGYSPVGIQELSRIIHERECSGNCEPILFRYPYIR